MAPTTQPWLEDLSEEWIAQPTPDTLARNAKSAAAAQTSQSVPPKPRSLLPRLRQSSGSFSEIHVRSIAHELRPPKQRSALAERSRSDNNIPPTSSPSASQLELSRSASLSFDDSAVCNGTVAHNTIAKSPVKEQGPHETPEWRRRLVQGDIGYGDQKDLFGPTGLENIFQKPTENTSEDAQQPKRKLGLLKNLSAIPSSPPPWPPARYNQKHRTQEDTKEAIESSQLEKPEHDSQQHHATQEQESSFSTQPPTKADQEAGRTVSGQIEFENESFSPVYLTTNLKIGQLPNATPNFRGSELANRLRQIGSPPTATYPVVQEESSLSHDQEDSSLVRLRDDSLPEGLPAGTPDLANVGRFVELRRGGYSRDGSFRKRPLSPSPGKKRESSTPSGIGATENTGADSNQASSVPQVANLKTPRRQGNSQFLSPERAKNSTSPLKLFDTHDTFTSNRFQRRLSQLENKSEKNTSSSVTESKVQITKVTQKTSRLTSVEESSFQNAVEDPFAEDQPNLRLRVSTFGQGQLNEHQFSGDFSFDDSDDLDPQDDSAPDGSPSMDVAPPGSRQPFKFTLESSPASSTRSATRKNLSGPATNPLRSMSRPKFQNHRKSSTATKPDSQEVAQEYAEGKRGPTSPFKNPTPKRRRTIHSVSEDEEEEEESFSSDSGAGTVHHPRVNTQSIVSRKRKDARHESSNNVADAETLARRHILRPRNPTPSQRRRDEIHAEIMEATEAFLLSSPKLNTIREQLDSSTASDGLSEQARATVVANEVAAFSIKEQHAMRNESRKRSVTTQDFLDEALKIMDFIRTKGRPTSGLGSLEETEAESQVLDESVEQGSSSLTFERPPSREGRLSTWAEPNKPKWDPNVMNHLRKYQEKETDTFLNSSINSIRLSRMNGAPTPEGESIVIEQDDIRITDDPTRHARTKTAEDDHIGSQPRTNGTQQSAGSSLGHTVATNGSRRSEHVATLAPEAVAHLIPQQIAGMSFDRDKNIWVRQKSPSKEHRPEEEDQSGITESEEDPFGNIPDLSIDEIKEQDVIVPSPTRPQPTSETILEVTEREDLEEEGRPVTREGQGIAFTDVSSAPSKASNFGWSYPKTDTRATSWSTQAPRNWSTQKAPHVQTTYAIPESDEDDIEHEIQYFEGRGNAPPSVQHTRVRDITISFAEREVLKPEPQPISTQQNPSQSQWKPVGTPHKSSRKNSTHRQMNAASTLPHSRPRVVPKFTGDGDLSLLEEVPSKNYRMQLSMSVSAPVLGHNDKKELLAAPSSPVKGDLTFMLSDLPEFTLHQIDECEVPSRVVVKHDGTRFSKALEDRYAQGTADLVKALQDVEPDEPFWEDLRQVNLHDKALSNMHRLDELCCRLEELDVSDNEISQVKGIPYTVRRLQARNNCLTSLTSWTTLGNLQQLDVSRNDIDCLDGLAELVHLRVLNISNNKIRSLDGILHLDGLMELNAGGNELEMVDFARSDLKSLTDLDLRGNRLLEVRNIHDLPQLQHLNLDDNEIDEFPLLDSRPKPCGLLRSIRICRNGLSLLDVDRHFPNLESLYVDGNCLSRVSGLEHLRYLRTLSAREQALDSDSDAETYVGNLVSNTEVRNLYISLNPTHGLGVSQHLLSLQRIELASMGLKELPDNFGQLMPNLRSLNLNFNSLRDLRPLLNIKRLNELLLAGNKLERLRANAMVLGRLETLTKLDWRDNPLTLRFYAPASENRVMSLRHKPSDEQLTDRFVLPAGDAETDVQHLSRLDYETRIRRRVTEMMLANLCKNLRELDGLTFDKSRVLVKDDVWERLLFLGVIQRKQPGKADDNTE